MPYDPNGWTEALHRCNLSHKFPNLIKDITFGSPIGNPPPLSKTFLLQNLPLAALYPHLIDNELQTETQAHRMSGPYTINQAHTIFCGHFHTSPVGLVEKHPRDGIWRMIRHLSKQDDEGCSTNGWVDSNNFPTFYYPAATVVAYVSYLSTLSYVRRQTSHTWWCEDHGLGSDTHPAVQGLPPLAPMVCMMWSWWLRVIHSVVLWAADVMRCVMQCHLARTCARSATLFVLHSPGGAVLPTSSTTHTPLRVVRWLRADHSGASWVLVVIGLS